MSVSNIEKYDQRPGAYDRAHPRSSLKRALTIKEIEIIVGRETEPCMIWKVPTGLSNCFRSCTYSTAQSKADCMILNSLRYEIWVVHCSRTQEVRHSRPRILKWWVKELIRSSKSFTRRSKSSPDIRTAAPLSTGPSTFSKGRHASLALPNKISYKYHLELHSLRIPTRRCHFRASVNKLLGRTSCVLATYPELIEFLICREAFEAFLNNESRQRLNVTASL